MINFILGKLRTKTKGFVVIENSSGIGFKIFMADSEIEKLPEINSEVKIYTNMIVRENEISLYGFINKETLKLFELLITVSGIGAKSAITLVANTTPAEFALYVISNDVNSITKLPGIGKKTAARIILELQDKLKTDDAINFSNEEIAKNTNKNYLEAIEGLKVLGYTKTEITSSLKNEDVSSKSIEEIIKIALKNLAK